MVFSHSAAWRVAVSVMTVASSIFIRTNFRESDHLRGKTRGYFQ
jgi:hypothetical protein